MGRVQSSKLQEEQSRMNKIFVFVCLEVLVDTALAARRFGPSCPDNYPCPSNLAYMGNTTNLPGKPYPLCGADVEDCTAYWTCASADGTYTGVPRRLQCGLGGFDYIDLRCTLPSRPVACAGDYIQSLS